MKWRAFKNFSFFLIITIIISCQESKKESTNLSNDTEEKSTVFTPTPMEEEETIENTDTFVNNAGEEFLENKTKYLLMTEASDLIEFFGQYSQKDIFNFLFPFDSLSDQDYDTTYISQFQIEKEKIITQQGDEEKGYLDSALMIFVTYTEQEFNEYSESSLDRSEVIVLKLFQNILSTFLRKSFNIRENYIESGYQKVEDLSFKKYQLCDSAFAPGLLYTYAEGGDNYNEYNEILSIYIIVDKELEIILELVTKQGTYEADYAPGIDSFSSTQAKIEITISDEKTNGFFNILLTTSYNEYKDGELADETTENKTLIWNGYSYE